MGNLSGIAQKIAPKFFHNIFQLTELSIFLSPLVNEKQ